MRDAVIKAPSVEGKRSVAVVVNDSPADCQSHGGGPPQRAVKNQLLN